MFNGGKYLYGLKVSPHKLFLIKGKIALSWLRNLVNIRFMFKVNVSNTEGIWNDC